MSTSNSDTQSISDRKPFIKQELLPNIAKMRRYLGAIDYDTHFYHRKQGRQTSWEFEDKETEDIFQATIIGEIASPIHGTLLKGIGNFKPPKSDPVRHYHSINAIYDNHHLFTEPSLDRQIQHKECHRPSKNNRFERQCRKCLSKSNGTF